MHIKSSLDFTAIDATMQSLKRFVSMLQQVYQNLTLAFNGNIGFGDGSNADNISGSWINVVAPAAPNTDFAVNHNLNRLPVGYWIMQKDRACDVYTGSVASTKTQLTLRATVASAVLRLFVVCALLFFAPGAKAQTTNLTVQVTDSGGQSWNNGTYTVTLVTPPGITPYGPPFFLSGTTTPVPNQSQSGSMNGTGSFTVTLTQNSGILPSQSQWRFVACSLTTAKNNCFTQFATVTAVTTLTVTPPALSVDGTSMAIAYNDTEVNSGVGGIYFNITTGLVRNCAAATGTVCTLWQNLGGGTGALLQTNGVNNTVQNILNLIQGSGITLTANGSGGVTVGAPTAAIKPQTSDNICYVSVNGNDSNDGLSIGTAKLTVYSCLTTVLPGGTSTTAGNGTILLSGAPSYGGPVTNQGFWLMGSGDPNYASPPSGWLKGTTGAGNPPAITIDCFALYGAGPHGHTAHCGLSAGSATLPPVWISSIAGNITINNVGFNPFYGHYVNYGIDSNGNRNGSGGSSGFAMNNVTWNGGACNGVGPGMDIGSQSFWIWIDQPTISGCAKEIFTIAASGAVRSSGTTTITTTATNDIPNGDTVTITNVTDDSFNGSFVATVVDGTHFTYANAGPNATSGTGQVVTARAAAINIDSGATGPGSGLIFITRANLNNGNIRYKQGANGGSFYVKDVSYEGDFVSPDAPTVLITGTSSTVNADGTNIRVDNVEVSDTSNLVPGVQVDNPTSFPDLVVVSRIAGFVRGKMTVLGGTDLGSGSTATYIRQQQYGVRQGQVVGTGIDVARRGFSPTVARGTNIANTSPSSWVFSPGSGTITSGIAAPDGTTNAGRVTGTGMAFVQFYGSSTALNLGDIYIFGVWVRSNTNNGYANSVPPIKFSFNNNGFGVGDGCASAPGSSPGLGVVLGNASGGVQSDGQWQWYSGVCKVAANPTTPGTFFGGSVDSTHTADFYAPTLVLFPSGTLSDNESYEIALNMAPWPSAASAGDISSLPGQFLRLPDVPFFGLGTVADGDIAHCTNCVVQNPCAAGGTGAIAQRIGGVWNCASASSGGGTPASPNLSIQYNNSGGFGGIPVPISPNGVTQNLGATPSGGVGTTGAFHLAGVIPRVTVCPSNLDAILATDRAGLVEWNDASACAVTLPQAGSGIGTNNDFTTNFLFLGCDIGTGTATVTPTTSTISYLSGGVFHSAQAFMSVTTGQCAFIYSDNTNYFGVIISAVGVTSFTGDSVVYSNSGSTGTVTLTLNTQLANKVFANCTGSTATPTFCSITLAMLPGAGATTVNGQSCALGGTCTVPPGTITIANAGTTGTTTNTLTKLTGAPSTAVITNHLTDTSGAIGITTSGAGTTGSAVIQLLGSVSCVFDGATIAGDYVQLSTTADGDCHDTNSSTYPTSGQVVGRVLSTNGAAGTYTIDLFPAEITPNSANIVFTANKSDIINQSTSQTTVVLSSVASGLYRIHYYADQNALCTTGANGVNFTFSWTDAGGSRSLQTGNLSLGTAQVTSGYLSGVFDIFVNSGNVSYISTVVGLCASGTSSYDLHARLEKTP